MSMIRHALSCHTADLSNTDAGHYLHSPQVTPLRTMPQRLSAMQELWRYSYPHHKDSVPSWSVPIIALCAPILFITVYAQLWRASRLEVHNAILGGLSCVIFTALVTNLVKLAVRNCKPLLKQLRCLRHKHPKLYHLSSGCTTSAHPHSHICHAMPLGQRIHHL